MKTLKLIYFFIKPQKKLFLFFILVTTITSYIELITMYLIIPVINIIMKEEVGGGSEFISKLIFMDNKMLNFGIILSISSIVLLLFKTMSHYFSILSVQKILIFWQDYVMKLIIKSDFTNIQRYTQGDFYFIKNDGIVSITNILFMLSQLIIISFKIFFYMGLLFFLSFKMTLISIPAAVVLSILVRYINKVNVRKPSEIYRDASHKRSNLIHEIMSGLKMIKIYQAEEQFIKRYYDILKVITRSIIKISFSKQIVIESLGIIPYVGVGIFGIVIGMNPNLLSDINYGEIGVYILAVMRLFPSVSTLSSCYLTFSSGMPNSDKVYEFINEINELEEKSSKKFEEDNISSIDDIRFDDVCFNYGNNQILNKVSFKIQKGEVVALVGGSGAGKTTILNLLLKLLRPEAGEIYINGKRMGCIKRESIYNNIGFVSQNVFLFHDTIENNIKIFRDLNDEEMMKNALEISNTKDYLKAVGYNIHHIVENDGANISGGQKQRVAIARAILFKPDLIILDEATNALDNINESEIINALLSLDYKPIILIVAHRLSYLKDVDEIIVLHNGKIVEIGSYDELMSQGGTFNNLYSLENKV